MMIRPILKDPEAVRTYGLYWGDTLTAGDTISTVTWTIPDGMTKVSEGPNLAAITEDGETFAIGTVALVRLDGGVDGTVYSCVCHIVTANGDEDERTLEIVAKER
jgi:hypothetical protein